ncbi:IS481 family transposase, partial [Aestuariimicrobium sp. p3-SID1156]|uniref:IS481 family transposase n=1 Tax=Aestuariimicrobium sp. p3-SID1156 TaxID=2916038 RepID=UPI00223BA18F
MSRERVIVLSVIEQGLSKAETARKFKVTWRWVHTLVQRYEQGGIEAVEPRSKRPHTNSRATPQAVRRRIIELRAELGAAGLDHGPASIRDRLALEGHPAPPSTSTIRRVLTDAGLVTPEPRKRPHSSLRRFEADQPNQCWQSDVTHWPLADGTDTEILSWLDDHSRYLLGCTAHHRVGGHDVVTDFTRLAQLHGLPASTLTDNGSIYTSRFTGGRNAFEYLLQRHHIVQKNGRPGHPQTQGKIERFHQTLKRWLAAQPPPQDIAQLQVQLDRFAEVYNHLRPHKAIGNKTPAHAYTATPKAVPDPTLPQHPHYRVRRDIVDAAGHVSLRRGGKMHHLGVGRA